MHSEGIRAAIISKARNTKKWDTQELNKYALKHPEILICRKIKPAKCSVSIKVGKFDTKADKFDAKEELDEILNW